jgi:hypothetical protein
MQIAAHIHATRERRRCLVVWLTAIVIMQAAPAA